MYTADTVFGPFIMSQKHRHIWWATQIYRQCQMQGMSFCPVSIDTRKMCGYKVNVGDTQNGPITDLSQP